MKQNQALTPTTPKKHVPCNASRRGEENEGPREEKGLSLMPTLPPLFHEAGYTLEIYGKLLFLSISPFQSRGHHTLPHG